MNLTQVKATAKKRHELLIKRHEEKPYKITSLEVPPQVKEDMADFDFICQVQFKDGGIEYRGWNEGKDLRKVLGEHFNQITLSDVYETMAQEGGFNDWNGYSAFLKEQDENELDTILQDFVNPLFSLQGVLFVHELRDFICDHFHLENKELAPLSAAVRDLILRLEPKFVQKYEGVPVNPDYDTKSITFYDDFENFVKGLNQVGARDDVCWRCRDSYKNTNIASLDMNLDLKTIKKQDHLNIDWLEERLSLCHPCAADYMNSFNRFSNPKAEDVWFMKDGELIGK